MRVAGAKLGSYSTYRGLGNQLWDLAGNVPSLDLNFAESKSLVDATTGQNLVTFTRASSGTYVGSDGVLQTAANDVPRFDHNPTTGESLGLLVEEQRTNSIRNNTMVGAVAGTPGTAPTNWTLYGSTNGLTQQIVGAGTESGIAYIDIRYSGTASGSASGTALVRYEASTQIAAASGQTWAASEYVSLAAGSLANVTALQSSIIERNGAGSFLTSGSTTIVPTSSRLIEQRSTVTRTLNNASTAFVTSQLLVSFSAGAVLDFTLRIGLPQLEQGAFATSVIPTTTTALTRSADVASITGTNFSSWYRQDEGSWYCSANSLVFDSNERGLFGIDTGNFARGYHAATNSPTRIRTRRRDATNNIAVDANSSAGTTARVALVVSSLEHATTYNGGAIQTNATALTLDPITDLRIGYQNIAGTAANLYLCGCISRITYWPQRLPNSTLQTITL